MRVRVCVCVCVCACVCVCSVKRVKRRDTEHIQHEGSRSSDSNIMLKCYSCKGICSILKLKKGYVLFYTAFRIISYKFKPVDLSFQKEFQNSKKEFWQQVSV